MLWYVRKQLDGITDNSAARDYIEGISDALWLLQEEPKIVTDKTEYERNQKGLNELKKAYGMDEELYEFDEE